MENFNSVLSQLNLLYGIELNEDDAIEIALIGWNKIGNKQHRLYRYCATPDSDDFSIQLPCNCDEIEAVTYGGEDWNYTSSTHINGDIDSHFVENYIESRKFHNNPLYTSGGYAKYHRVGDTLYFEDNCPVTILYKGIELDENDLPYLTQKEVDALACYIACTQRFKQGWALHNTQMIQEAQLLEQRWLKLCDAARVPSYMNQNDINRILDAKVSFNRKIFNKSYKPVK